MIKDPSNNKCSKLSEDILDQGKAGAVPLRFLLVSFVFVTALGSVQAFGADKKSPKVLDFEADLIEGERKAPNVFIDMEINRPTLDLVLYQRNNFNDFHMAEKNRRPRYFHPSALPQKAETRQPQSLPQGKKNK